MEAEPKGYNVTRNSSDQEEFPLDILAMPATVLNEGFGGWGVFAPAGRGKLQIGWISPPMSGKFSVSVGVDPQVAPLGVGFEPCDFSGDFPSFEDAVAGIRAFLASKRIPPSK